MKLLDDMIQLAREIDVTDPIDFKSMNLDEDAAYKTIGLELIERWADTPHDHRELMLLSTCLHLVVDNMVLNMKVLANQ